MEKDKTAKVLIVIDMQNDFIDGSLGSEAAQAIVPNVVDKIKNFDGDAIFLTRDTHFVDYMNYTNYLDTNEGKKLPVEHCIYGTEGWELNKDVKKALLERFIKGDIVLDCVLKQTFGSVEGVKTKVAESLSLPELVLKLEDGTENPIPMEIEMCGLCTDICVVSNALILKAFTYDFAEITVDSKCCAGVTPEKHEAALEVMRSCQINVI